MTQTVHVDLPGRAYDVVIGPGVMGEAGARIAQMGGRRHVVIVTEANVAAAHLAGLRDSLSAAGLTSDALVLDPRARRPRTGPTLCAPSNGCWTRRSNVAT